MAKETNTPPFLHFVSRGKENRACPIFFKLRSGLFGFGVPTNFIKSFITYDA